MPQIRAMGELLPVRAARVPEDLVNGLSQLGVPAARIHYEFFGPRADLQAA
jgi:ferredoxin-NADP reductase